jgi:hypothetical protein
MSNTHTSNVYIRAIHAHEQDTPNAWARHQGHANESEWTKDCGGVWQCFPSYPERWRLADPVIPEELPLEIAATKSNRGQMHVRVGSFG